MSQFGVSTPPATPVFVDDAEPIAPDQYAKRQIERYQRDTVAPYIPFTPVLSGTSGGFAYGTGAYQLGRYKRVGPECQYEFLIYFGNPGFIPGGNTTWNISVPVTPSLPPLPLQWGQRLGGVVFFNQGVGQIQNIHACEFIGPPAVRRFRIPISNTAVGTLLTGTVPAKGQGAFLEGNMRYEVAY